MDGPCLSVRVDAWRQVLSPWIAALTGRLSLPLDWTPCQNDLHEDLWIKFNAEDTAETRLDWHAWLEAFELLDLVVAALRAGADQEETRRYLTRLKHVLKLAEAITTGRKTHSPRHIVSLYFCSTPHTIPEARDIIRRIACVIPVHTLELKESARRRPYHDNDICGPFLWRMLAPQPSVRPHLGLHWVSVTSDHLQRPDSICAVYSAIAHSHTLREFAFFGRRRHDMAAWLSFSLFSKTATHNIRTALV